MSVGDALQILRDGRTLHGSVELDDHMLTWSASFDGHRTITVLLGRLDYDEPIPFDLDDIPPDVD